MRARSLLFVSALATVATSQAAGLAGNSIAVYSVGSGAVTLSSAAQATSVIDFGTNGAILSTYAAPSTGSSSLTNSGSATSEGQLTLSADGKTLLFAGYRADAGTASIAGSTSANNPRVVGTLNVGTGLVDTSTTTAAFSANNPRVAYSFDSVGYYAAGANSGVVGGTLGSGSGTTIGTPVVANLRYLSGFGGNLYFSSSTANAGTGATRGVYQVDPTTGVQTSILALGTATAPVGSPYAFQFLSATSLLVADDTAATGGLTLYTNTGSGFTAAATLAGSPTRSFAYNNGAIYFTSADGTTLSTVSLTGTTFGAVTPLATAAANTVFRGVAFVPQAVPEPSAFAALGLGALGLLRRRRKA